MIDSTTNHFFASGIVSAHAVTQGRSRGRVVFIAAICLVILNSFLSSAANAQTNQWYWTGGTHVALSNQTPSGSWGALGVPSLGNIPSDRQGATTWTDSSGNFWLFGGQGTDSNPPGSGYLNDLWKFNPSTLEWTWMGGSN
ncbi:MAG: kelch repeat-containing protein, partial [Terracidiphilus sp.]|nr:kelch repeat-containing protein [Terracidiphilus sp.]